MKYLWKMIVIFAFFVSGCSSKQDTSAQEKLEEYETYYEMISSNTQFSQASDNFTIALEMSQIPDGTYRYVIVVDEPKIVMNDIVMMAVVNQIPYDEATSLMPSNGVFESRCSLVPNQVNKQQGIVKGIAISGESTEDSIHVEILVQYKNAKLTKQTREFFSYRLDTQGYTYEVIEKE